MLAAHSHPPTTRSASWPLFWGAKQKGLEEKRVLFPSIKPVWQTYLSTDGSFRTASSGHLGSSRSQRDLTQNKTARHGKSKEATGTSVASKRKEPLFGVRGHKVIIRLNIWHFAGNINIRTTKWHLPTFTHKTFLFQCRTLLNKQPKDKNGRQCTPTI